MTVVLTAQERARLRAARDAAVRARLSSRHTTPIDKRCKSDEHTVDAHGHCMWCECDTRPWTRETAIQALRLWASRHRGHVPFAYKVRDDLPDRSVYLRLFGSFNAYVEAASRGGPSNAKTPPERGLR